MNVKNDLKQLVIKFLDHLLDCVNGKTSGGKGRIASIPLGNDTTPSEHHVVMIPHSAKLIDHAIVVAILDSVSLVCAADV